MTGWNVWSERNGRVRGKRKYKSFRRCRPKKTGGGGRTLFGRAKTQQPTKLKKKKGQPKKKMGFSKSVLTGEMQMVVGKPIRSLKKKGVVCV